MIPSVANGGPTSIPVLGPAGLAALKRGDRVQLTYAGFRLAGQKWHAVKSVGPKWVTTDTNFRVRTSGLGAYGIAAEEYETEVVAVEA